MWSRKTFGLDDFPALLVFSIFHLEVGVGVAIWLNFDSFSVLPRELNTFLSFFPIFGGLGWASTPCAAVSTRGLSCVRPSAVGAGDA